MDWVFDVSVTALVVIGIAAAAWVGARRREKRRATVETGMATAVPARLGFAGGRLRRGRLRVEPGSLTWEGEGGRSVDLTSARAEWVARAAGWRGESDGRVELALLLAGDDSVRLVLDVEDAAVVLRRLGDHRSDSNDVGSETPGAAGLPSEGEDAVMTLHHLAPHARRHVGARTWEDPRRPDGAVHEWRRDLLSQMPGPAALAAVLAFLAALPADTTNGRPASSALPAAWAVVGAVAVVAWGVWLTMRARRELGERTAALAAGPTPMMAILTADLAGGPGLVMAEATAPGARLLGVPLREPLPVGTAAFFAEHGPVEVQLRGVPDVDEYVVVDVSGNGAGLRLFPAGPVADLGPDGLLEVVDSPGWLARHG